MGPRQDTVTQLREKVAELLNTQKLAVLATHDQGFPYSSLIAFAASGDLTRILFTTPETTRKYANLMADPRVSLLIDSRTHQDADFHSAAAVTALGTASVMDNPSSEGLLKTYLARHPYLDTFVSAATTRVIEVAIQRYYLVERFQNVMELHINP